MFAIMLKYFMHALVFALPLASALPWEGPAPTPAPAVNTDGDLGWTPMPSSAPAALFAAYELKKRQASSALTSRSSSTEYHATCGFLNGDPSYVLTCVNTAYKCVTDTSRGVYGCCSDLASCALKTSCIPQSALSSCTGACVSNSFIAKCNPTSAFCIQNILVATGSTTFTNWYCDDSPTIYTLFPTPTSGTLTIPYVYVTMSIPSSSTTSISTTSTVSPSPTTTQSVASITSTSPTPTPPTSTPGKKTPIGAIVGGVVGGIVVIVALIVGLICLKRKDKKTPPAPVEVPVGHPGPGYGPVPAMSTHPGAGGFYQPAIAEKEAPLPTGNYQQGRSEMYGSPPHSPAPQYTPTYPAGKQQPPQNIYPNVSEMQGGEISAHAAPGSY